MKKLRFGGMDASMMTRLKELEDENRRLKKMYAEERLKAEIIQDAMAKIDDAIASKADGTARGQKPERQRAFCCKLFAVSESCYRYQPQLNAENDLITDWLLRITGSQRN